MKPRAGQVASSVLLNTLLSISILLLSPYSIDATIDTTNLLEYKSNYFAFESMAFYRIFKYIKFDNPGLIICGCIKHLTLYPRTATWRVSCWIHIVHIHLRGGYRMSECLYCFRNSIYNIFCEKAIWYFRNTKMYFMLILYI